MPTASTVQHSTVQYSTVQYSTVQYTTLRDTDTRVGHAGLGQHLRHEVSQRRAGNGERDLYCTVLYCTVLYCTVLYCNYDLR